MADEEIQILQHDIANLQAKLQEKHKRLHELQFKNSWNGQNIYSTLSATEVSKYSRQMLIPQIGVTGQRTLKNSKVLVVGTGGLGCPAALYLAAAGVGEITLVDSDEVDLTNLHRQILHSELDLGVPKVRSGFETLNRINSDIKIIPLHMHVDSASLSALFKRHTYTVVVDGTDNVATRYLLNDVCVFNGVPLVSGSALQMEGQLTVYNYKEGPCYRCLFPIPPPVDTVASCGDSGVLGVVPGVIGVLEALEAIKIITSLPDVLSGRLLLFDASMTTFSNITLRNKQGNCDVCGTTPTITAPIDYEQFCGAKAHDKVENINILESGENINVTEFSKEMHNNPLLIDVRPSIEYEMCFIPNSFNVPYNEIKSRRGIDILKRKLTEISPDCKVFVICRRGNDSQRAVGILKKEFSTLPVKFINITGGLHAYSDKIDSSFPVY